MNNTISLVTEYKVIQTLFYTDVAEGATMS